VSRGKARVQDAAPGELWRERSNNGFDFG